MGSTSGSRIPDAWLIHIARSARRYATDSLHPDDLRQTGAVTYVVARQRYNPDLGPFEPYAKRAIKNAMIRARQGEQRQHDLPSDGRGGPPPIDAWSEEAERVEVLMARLREKAVGEWKMGLSPKDLIVVDGLFFQDLAQREVAEKLGVSQARVSQRRSDVLKRAVRELARLKLH